MITDVRITKIRVENFRSLEEVELEPRALTILYGPTASGKSSLLYALLVAKNFVSHPNRPVDAFFDLGFLNLGGLEDVVYDRELTRAVAIGLSYRAGAREAQYAMALRSHEAALRWIWPGNLEMEMAVPLPYGLNRTTTYQLEELVGPYAVEWNGITATVPLQSASAAPSTAVELAEWINCAAELLQSVDIAPHRRGFFKPSYTSTPTSPIPWTDDEVASTLLAGKGELADKVSVYLERVFQRDLRLHTPPGTSMAFLKTVDKAAVVSHLLVNDGYGVNQVVYMLAKALLPKNRLVLLEEPEVHLHPTALRKFTRALCEIARREQKQVILTTHSELLVISVLGLVREGKLATEDVRCYLCTKEDGKTTIQAQNVTPEGQIEGGLATFVEAELEDLKTLLGV